MVILLTKKKKTQQQQFDFKFEKNKILEKKNAYCQTFVHNFEHLMIKHFHQKLHNDDLYYNKDNPIFFRNP